MSQEREGQISEGSSSGEFKKSYDNPLLLTTISSIPEIVKIILDCHTQALEHTEKKSDEDPLFLATISNISEIVEEIIIHHPRALEYTNKEGMNILHVAILYRHFDIFYMVTEKFEVFSRMLLSASDNKGNSLLHMFGQKRKGQANEKMQNPALQLQKELLLFEVKFHLPIDYKHKHCAHAYTCVKPLDF